MEPVIGSAGVEVDFLELCRAGEDCAIALTLDGRALPTGALRIDGPANVIVEQPLAAVPSATWMSCRQR